MRRHILPELLDYIESLRAVAKGLELVSLRFACCLSLGVDLDSFDHSKGLGFADLGYISKGYDYLLGYAHNTGVEADVVFSEVHTPRV